MWEWVKGMVGRKKFDDDPGKVIEAGGVFSKGIAAQLLIQFTGAGLDDPTSLAEDKLKFFCGYVAAFSDVMSQSVNGQAGGNLSQTVTVRVFQEFFGTERARNLMQMTFEWMATDPPAFVEGMSTGGRDGNEFISRGMPNGLANYLRS